MLKPRNAKAHLWNELWPGTFWAYPVNDPQQRTDEYTQFATVIESDGRLWITCGHGGMELLNEMWVKFQFVRCQSPSRDEVEFQWAPIEKVNKKRKQQRP